MTVEELLKKLEKVPKKHRDKEVFVRRQYPGIGTIASVDSLVKDTYSFFGIDVPCYIIDHDS